MQTDVPPRTDPVRRPGTAVRRRSGGWVAGLAGFAAAALAMGAAELTALLTGPGSVPVIAVGTAVIPLVPGRVKQGAVSLFGTSDKTALIIGTAVLLAAAAFGIGVWARRRPAAGDAGIVLLAGIGAVAAGRAGVGGPGTVIPSLVAAVVGVIALRRLLAVVRRADTPPPAALARWDAPPAGATARGNAAGNAGSNAETGTAAARSPLVPAPRRRAVLATVGSATAAAGALTAAGALGMRWRFGADSARAKLVLAAPGSPAAAQPAGADPGVPGAVPFQTPAGDFYRIDTALFVPNIDPDGWRLRIHGMVDRELDLDLAALMRRPTVERWVTLTCVSNEVGGDLIGNARWLGVLLAPLLAEAGISPDASQLVSRDGRGMSIGTPVARVTDGRDAMLAFGMNGVPLPFEHGFPVRMVVPGLYGYVSACKWITDIEVTTFEAYDAYWVQRGWSQRGPVKISSRIDTPRNGASRNAGPVTVAGVAWNQHVGIRGVQVRVDDGPWVEAELAPAATADTWREWTWRWAAPSGRHRLSVRAISTDGAIQTAEQADTVPNGATGLHAVSVQIRS